MSRARSGALALVFVVDSVWTLRSSSRRAVRTRVAPRVRMAVASWRWV